MSLHEFQTWYSFVFTGIIISCNIIKPWASIDAVRLVIPFVIFYNTTDIVIGWHYYKTKGKIYILHHLMLIFGVIYIYFNLDNYDQMSGLVKWSTVGEISTIFNNIRILSKGKSFENTSKIMFAGSFLICRTLMTIGLIVNSVNNENKFLLPVSITFSALNVYWSYEIVKMMYKHYKTKEKIK